MKSCQTLQMMTPVKTTSAANLALGRRNTNPKPKGTSTRPAPKKMVASPAPPQMDASRAVQPKSV